MWRRCTVPGCSFHCDLTFNDGDVWDNAWCCVACSRSNGVNHDTDCEQLPYDPERMEPADEEEVDDDTMVPSSADLAEVSTSITSAPGTVISEVASHFTEGDVNLDLLVFEAARFLDAAHHGEDRVPRVSSVQCLQRSSANFPPSTVLCSRGLLL